MAWARRRERQDRIYPPRPPGLLVWVHATRGERISAIMQLAARLISQRSNAYVLVTLAPGVTGPKRLKKQIIMVPAPGLHPEDMREFLAHWRLRLRSLLPKRYRPRFLSEGLRSTGRRALLAP